MNKQSNIFFIGLVFALILLSTTAVKAETFYAYLTGAQENPPVSTSGSETTR
jgi:hypothetical protein